MSSNAQTNLFIDIAGVVFFLGGFIVAGRAWLTGHRWREPDAHAKAAEIEGTASLRFGTSAIIGGASVTAGGVLLQTASPAAMNGFAGGVAMVLMLELVVAVALLMRSGLKLYGRATTVRIRDRMPKRSPLYLVWSAPPDDDPSRLNLPAPIPGPALPLWGVGRD